MKCPYCGKVVRENMPGHLEKNPKCLDKHSEKLKREMRAILAQARRG